MKYLLYLLTLPIVMLLAACGNSNQTNQAIEVGANALNFTLPNAAGGEVSLFDYSGQPVLLYFHMAVG